MKAYGTTDHMKWDELLPNLRETYADVVAKRRAIRILMNHLDRRDRELQGIEQSLERDINRVAFAEPDTTFWYEDGHLRQRLAGESE